MVSDIDDKTFQYFFAWSVDVLNYFALFPNPFCFLISSVNPDKLSENLSLC